MMEPTKGEGVNFQEVFKVLFSSAISLETGKVLSYEVACNSCKYCVEKQQALKCKNITVEEYSEWLSEHEKTCQASEYGSNASTALESQLAPVVFRKSIKQKIYYSTVVADGNDKSAKMLEKEDVYGDYGINILREECLSHVHKRIRIHLCDKQKDYIPAQRTLMQHEVSMAKFDKQKRDITERSRSSTLRDLKKHRGKWQDDDEHDLDSKQINLLPDRMIDKITALYGRVIKSNSGSLENLRNSL